MPTTLAVESRSGASQAVSEPAAVALFSLNLEAEAFDRAQKLADAPNGKESFHDYRTKLNEVVMDGAARLLSLNLTKQSLTATDSALLLTAPPSLIADERFLLTCTPPEEYRRTGTLIPLKTDESTNEYYLVDRGEDAESFQEDFTHRRDVYLLRIRLESGEKRHDAQIDSYECSSGHSDSLKSFVEKRLFETQHPQQAALHQPKALPQIDENAVELASRMIEHDWGSYCWKERFRKLWTGTAWVGSIVGFIAYLSKFSNYEFSQPGLRFGATMGLNILGFGGLNLLMNNITDIKTSSRLDDIATVLRKKSSQSDTMQALSKLRPADFEFLAQRAENGNVTLTIGFRSYVETEVTLEDSEAVKMLATIGSAALMHRDELLAKGIFVPPADWFAVRLGGHVSARENEKRDKKLSQAIMDTVESFRAISWKASAK